MKKKKKRINCSYHKTGRCCFENRSRLTHTSDRKLRATTLGPHDMTRGSPSKERVTLTNREKTPPREEGSKWVNKTSLENPLSCEILELDGEEVHAHLFTRLENV